MTTHQEIIKRYKDIPDSELVELITEIKASQVSGTFAMDSLIRKKAQDFGVKASDLHILIIALCTEASFRWLGCLTNSKN